MGKGRRKNPVAAMQHQQRGAQNDQENRAELGCICPTGCKIGEAIPAGAHRLPAGAVKVICSNANCPGVPYIHEECFEKWQQSLVDLLKRPVNCYRDMSNFQLTKFLWTNKFDHLRPKFSGCPQCGGCLSRDVQDERAQEAFRQAAEAVLRPQQQQQSQPVQKMTRNQNDKPKKPNKELAEDNKQHVSSKVGDSIVVPGMGARPKVPTVTFPSPEGDQWQSVPSFRTKPRVPRQQVMKPSSKVVLLPPPGMAGWRGDDSDINAVNTAAPLLVKPSSTVKYDVDDMKSFPVLDERVWLPVQQQSAGFTVPSSADAYDPDNLSAFHFLRELEKLTDSCGQRLWVESEAVLDLMARVNISVMTAMADCGGLENWLEHFSSLLVVRKNCIVRVCDVAKTFKSTGTVELVSADGTKGIVSCPQFCERVFFDLNECTNEDGIYFYGYVVSFKAEKLAKKEWHDCNWQAVSMSLVQDNTQNIEANGKIAVGVNKERAASEAEMTSGNSGSENCSSSNNKQLLRQLMAKSDRTCDNGVDEDSDETERSSLLSDGKKQTPVTENKLPSDDTFTSVDKSSLDISEQSKLKSKNAEVFDGKKEASGASAAVTVGHNISAERTQAISEFVKSTQSNFATKLKSESSEPECAKKLNASPEKASASTRNDVSSTRPSVSANFNSTILQKISPGDSSSNETSGQIEEKKVGSGDGTYSLSEHLRMSWDNQDASTGPDYGVASAELMAKLEFLRNNF